MAMDTEQAVAAQADTSASVPAPTNVKEFEARLLEVADRLPKRLKQCADFVAANQDRIAVSTVAEMAEGAGVQSSAFMRFCQILGFSGFSEMQKLFRDSYAGGWPDYSTRLEHLRETAAGSAPALLAEFAEAGRTSLEGLLKTIEPDALEKAVKLRPEDPTINDHLGDAYWRADRQLEATFQWNHAIAGKPEPEELAKIEEKLKSGLADPTNPSRADAAKPADAKPSEAKPVDPKPAEEAPKAEPAKPETEKPAAN